MSGGHHAGFFFPLWGSRIFRKHPAPWGRELHAALRFRIVLAALGCWPGHTLRHNTADLAAREREGDK